MELLKVYDTVNKTTVELDEQGLIDTLISGRQVDVFLKSEKSDPDGYMTWNVEHWTSVSDKKFVRYYSLNERLLGEYTGHNIYDLKNEFKPYEAVKVELS